MNLPEANRNLKNAGLHVRIIKHGKCLYLVATLPLKPGDSGPRPRKQYRINTGAAQNAMGLDFAWAKALELAADMSVPGKFSWAKWGNPNGSRSKFVTVEEGLGLLKAELSESWEAKGWSADKIAHTWINEWMYCGFNRLEGEAITRESLLAAVQHYPVNTRGRKRACEKLRKLCRVVKKTYPESPDVAIDWDKYKGKYSSNKTASRVMPRSMDEVHQWGSKIPNIHWQLIYRLMALYGLRNHECWHCTIEEMEGMLVARIGPWTKTGARLCMPLRLDWMNEWGDMIVDTTPPEVTAISNHIYGQRTAKAFRVYKVPFTPYALRHFFAIRTRRDLALPDTSVSGSMGHSVEINNTVYQRHVAETESLRYWRDRLESRGVFQAPVEQSDPIEAP